MRMRGRGGRDGLDWSSVLRLCGRQHPGSGVILKRQGDPSAGGLAGPRAPRVWGGALDDEGGHRLGA